ncbi:MAG TPA: hypothetical protein VGD64_15895 [Acidisarcina sp.]
MGTIITNAGVSDDAAIHQAPPGEEAPPGNGGSLWAKLAFFIAVPIAFWFIAFFFIKTPIFRKHFDQDWISASSPVYTARNVNCEIVVYGDSSAITGVDPEVVQKMTHLKTCNIAQSKGALVVLGTGGLDVYLRNNQRPKYLVIQFAGPNFYKPTSWADSPGFMEGIVPLIRYFPKRDLISLLPRHPEVITGVLTYAFLAGPESVWKSRHSPLKIAGSPETPINVHFVRTEPAYSSCKQQADGDRIFHKPDPAFISGLRERYSKLADHLIIDVAPDTECDQRVPYLRAHLGGLDNTLQQYPVTLFNDGYTHYAPAGSLRLSQELANQINSYHAPEQNSLANVATHPVVPGSQR